MSKSFTRAISGCVLLVGLLLIPSANANNAAPGHPIVPAKALQLYNTENAAIMAGDYAKFVANGSPLFKAGLTKQMFDGACDNLSGPLRSGFTSTYAGVQAAKGDMVYSWILTLKDGTKIKAIMALTTSHKVDGYLFRPVSAAAH